MLRARDRRFARDLRAQHVKRLAVERFEKLRFPLRPDFGRRGADVGHREEVERVKALLGADERRKARNDVRVGNVFLLRDPAHGEVFAHEKDDEVRICLAEAEAAAEIGCFLRAHDFMPAAEPFADIVEEPGDDDAPVLRNFCHHLRAEGIFVRKFASGEAPDVAHDAQRMLVDREDVVEVVLHLPDDVPECNEKASENRPRVHHLERVVGPAGELQDLKERCLVGRIAPVGRTHRERSAPERAQKPRGHAGELRVRRKDDEGSQNGVGIPDEDLVVDEIHFIAAGDKSALKPHGGRLFVAAEEPVGNGLQLNDRHLRDRLRVQVVALHQRFRAAHDACRPVAEAFGDRFLEVEKKPVLMTPRNEVQLDAKHLQEAEAALDRFLFARRDEVRCAHLRCVGAEPGSAGAPEKDLDVAQSAGRLLQIRLERIGRVFVALVPPRELEHLVAEKGACVEFGVKVFARIEKERCASPKEAAFKIGGRNGHILGGFGEELFARSNRCAHRKAELPERCEKGGNPLGKRFVAGAVKKHEQVNVRKRKELPPAVAAHGRHSDVRLRQISEPNEVRHRTVECLGVLQKKAVGVAFACLAAPVARERFALGSKAGLDERDIVGAEKKRHVVPRWAAEKGTPAEALLFGRRNGEWAA